jgi:hypothetical protein
LGVGNKDGPDDGFSVGDTVGVLVGGYVIGLGVGEDDGFSAGDGVGTEDLSNIGDDDGFELQILLLQIR